MSEVNNRLGVAGYVVARAYRNNKFDEDGNLIELGEFLWEERGPNIIPDVGISHILQTCYTQEDAASAALYVGLLNNYTPVAGTTMANIGTNEITNYNEAARQAYTGVESAKTASNTASPASFTISAGGAVVYGAFLSDSSTKGGTTGLVLGAKLFASSRTLLEADVLNITYAVTGSSS